MGKTVFISRSSDRKAISQRKAAAEAKSKKLNEPKQIEIDIAVPKKATIFWIGNDLPDQFLESGNQLGFDILKLEGDITVLINAKAVIVCEVETYTFKRTLSVINLAVNYNVPVFWINKTITPHQWMFSFKQVFIGDTNRGCFWRGVLQWIV